MPDWTKTTITVNGQTYASIDEMPPDVRRQYEQAMSMMADRNNNGVPDAFEGQGTGEGTFVSQVTTASRSFINGQEIGASTRSLIDPPSRGGVTVHLSWGTILIFAFLLAAAGALIAFLLQR